MTKKDQTKKGVMTVNEPKSRNMNGGGLTERTGMPATSTGFKLSGKIPQAGRSINKKLLSRSFIHPETFEVKSMKSKIAKKDNDTIEEEPEAK